MDFDISNKGSDDSKRIKKQKMLDKLLFKRVKAIILSMKSGMNKKTYTDEGVKNKEKKMWLSLDL